MALLETFAIVLIGICVGSVGYTGISSQALVRGSFSSHVNTLALSVYDFFSGDTRSADGVLSPDASLFENKEEVVHDPEVKNIFIIAPQASMSEGAAAEIERMFSDPVEVSIDENDPQWGTVIPQFEGMQGEPHRFFVVPVHSEESS